MKNAANRYLADRLRELARQIDENEHLVIPASVRIECHEGRMGCATEVQVVEGDAGEWLESVQLGDLERGAAELSN